METPAATSKTASLRRSAGAFAVAALAALAACAQGGDVQTAVVRTVVVTVVAQGAEPPPNFTCYRKTQFSVCVSEDPIVLPGDIGAANTISWTLVGSDWEFDRNKGIDIRPMSSWRMTEKEARSYSAFNKRDGKPYKYSINVRKGATELSWDPTIMN
jgi:hypothetical protein